LSSNKRSNSAIIVKRSPEWSSNAVSPGLALLTAAPDYAGIASLRAKLSICIIFCYCLKISNE
jgi:hypothetical protein